jgi:hypothetical protein
MVGAAASVGLVGAAAGAAPQATTRSMSIQDTAIRTKRRMAFPPHRLGLDENATIDYDRSKHANDSIYQQICQGLDN